MNNIYELFKNYNKNYKDTSRLEHIRNDFIHLLNREENNKNTKPIIIYGAGVVTLPCLLELLEVFKVMPIAIVDSDKNKWGRKINNITVNSLQEVHCNYGIDVTVIIAVRGNKQDMLQINDSLKKLGYKDIIQCSTWLSYREILQLKDYNLMLDKDDSYIAENLENILWLNEILEDEASRQALSDIILSRLNPVEYRYKYFETSYFPENMFSKSAYNYVVDCGAYRGDTLKEFLNTYYCEKNLKEYHAFEIDPVNIEVLQKFVNSYNGSINSKIHIHAVAVNEFTESIRICADGSIGSHVDKNGDMVIEAVALDDVLENSPVTLIKMDIEGAEQSALLGARNIIKKYRPVLVISLYHRCRDLWEIPKFIHNLVDSYIGILRLEGLFEYIYFAIPRELYLDCEKIGE